MGVREWQYIPFESNRMISVYDSGFVFFFFFLIPSSLHDVFVFFFLDHDRHTST